MTTAKEELAEVTESCLEALSELSKFEKSLAKDSEGVERTIRQLEGRRGNEAVTAEVGQAIATHVRQAIAGIQLNAEGIHVLMLLLIRIALLAELDSGAEIENPGDTQKEFQAWFERWTAAKDAWDKYTS
jgi:hypothetical protein